MVSYRRLVEQACAGVVVGRLPEVPPDPNCRGCHGEGSVSEEHEPWATEQLACDCIIPPCESIPVASVGPFVGLSGDVARGLLEGRADCEGMCCGGSGYRNDDPVTRCEKPPPFAAAYAEVTIDGEWWRGYVLVSAPCGGCDGTGLVCVRSDFTVAEDGKCDLCNGTGARVDVKAIADRYQPDRPWRDEDTAREARFRVRVG
jgi:hypothetical protein